MIELWLDWGTFTHDVYTEGVKGDYEIFLSSGQAVLIEVTQNAKKGGVHFAGVICE